MSFVHVLDDNTINKIAAGEVVERPASVVKELVENAIDAHADRVEVEIMAGGTSFIRVTDNGIGMSREDAELAILRHATSKIFKVDDLLSIDTLGFRGEALPSIAAVSRFSLRTRQAGAELGTQIKITGGKDPDINETGCSIGTTIQVEDLFFNTPARKKFLKTNNTEGSKINEFIIKLAISKPNIAFKLINNGKISVTTPGNGSLKDTLQSIYGATVGGALLPLEFEDEDIRLSGFVSKPSAIRSSRSWQTFIVNGRIISSRAISKAIDNAYHALIPKTGYPLIAMNIQVPQNTIDVNVHPQKSEMKFEDEGRIFKAVYKAVLDAVRPKGEPNELGGMAAGVEHVERHVEHGLQELFSKEDMQAANQQTWGGVNRPSAAAWGGMNSRSENIAGSAQNQLGGNCNANADEAQFTPNTGSSMSWYEVAARVHDMDRAARMRSENNTSAYSAGTSSSYENGPEKPLHWREQQAEFQTASLPQSQAELPGSHAQSEPPRPQAGQMVPIGQVDDTYIIAQDAVSLYIVDQHAAHERILFDRYASEAVDIPIQQLLVHIILNFSPQEAQLIEQNLELLRELGIGLEPSGPEQFRLTEVPADIDSAGAEDFIREILESIQEMHRPSAAELRHMAIATMACKAAIKAGYKLNFRQMEVLLQDLNNTAMPYTCPHGRPTIIKFSNDELAKMFKRTGF